MKSLKALHHCEKNEHCRYCDNDIAAFQCRVTYAMKNKLICNACNDFIGCDRSFNRSQNFCVSRQENRTQFFQLWDRCSDQFIMTFHVLCEPNTHLPLSSSVQHICQRSSKLYRNIFKGRVHCFSIQVVMNKSFLLNPKKEFWPKSVLSFSRNTQKMYL